MNQNIKRHNIAETILSGNVEFFREEMDELEENIKNRPQICGTIFIEGYEAIGDSVASMESKKNTLEIIEIVKDVGINHFRNTLNAGETNFQLFGKAFLIKTEPTNSYTDPIFWTKCFYTALMGGDRKVIDELVKVPEDIMKKSKLKCDEVDFAIVRFLKGLYQSNVDLAKLLKEALELTDIEINKPERADYLEYLKFPELNLYRLIFSNDNDQFNIELSEALEFHKKFWGSKKNQNASEGWISMPIICACLIAYESKGYQISVDSDYLPQWLFKREY